jgi:hypothetical protein
MNCCFIRQGKFLVVCSRCGRSASCDESSTPTARCLAGLGDYVAAGLSSIGITKERVEAVFGGPCECSERQAAMNAAAAKWLGMSPGSTAPPEIDPGTP